MFMWFLVATTSLVHPAARASPRVLLARSVVPTMAVETDTASPSATPTVAAERYVATNRFRVKEGRGAAFEKRWAERKSRLGMLDGFRFFCMLRLTGEWDGEAPNYMSCTVWEEEAQFDAWKKGDAFKEAHGGGTIGGVASMVLATMQNTKGKPKVALWDGLLPVSVVPPAPTPGTRRREADRAVRGRIVHVRRCGQAGGAILRPTARRCWTARCTSP